MTILTLIGWRAVWDAGIVLPGGWPLTVGDVLTLILTLGLLRAVGSWSDREWARRGGDHQTGRWWTRDP